jgi:hypothetical protein
MTLKLLDGQFFGGQPFGADCTAVLSQRAKFIAIICCLVQFSLRFAIYLLFFTISTFCQTSGTVMLSAAFGFFIEILVQIGNTLHFTFPI